MIGFVQNRLSARSIALVRKMDVGMPKLMIFWVVAASFLAGLRAAFPVTPVTPGLEQFGQALPYLLIVGAPVAALLFGLSYFPANSLYSQPQFRLARWGRWTPVDMIDARSMPLFGATGMMTSLLIGMLLNIPVRAVEFMIAIPALGGEAPPWLQTLFLAMLADVVVMTSFYALAFVLALRHVPLFPRFLVAVWCFDILAQLCIASAVAGTSGLPSDVAAQLQNLLRGNLEKVLISAALWLPYLLVSERVNLTYRRRVRA